MIETLNLIFQIVILLFRIISIFRFFGGYCVMIDALFEEDDKTKKDKIIWGFLWTVASGIVLLVLGREMQTWIT